MARYLIPREHGAYVQLGFPLLSGLALGSPGAASWLYVLAAVLLFFAHEPLVMLLGIRGKRQQQQFAAQARWQLAALGAAGVIAGLAALWLSSPATRWLALVPGTIACALVPMALSKKLKSLPGELLAATAFAAMHLPPASAGGVTGVLLWGPAAMWCVVTVVATLCVHAIKSRVTGTAPALVPVTVALSWAVLIVAVALAIGSPAWRLVAIAASIPLAAVVVVNHLAPSTRKLKEVGWTVFAVNALAMGVIAIGA